MIKQLIDEKTRLIDRANEISREIKELEKKELTEEQKRKLQYYEETLEADNPIPENYGKGK